MLQHTEAARQVDRGPTGTRPVGLPDAGPRRAPGHGASGAGAAPRRMSILLVDDDPVVREVLGLMLAHEGHTVHPARDARQALQEFVAGRFDLVVTDWAMPETDGGELAAAVKKLSPETPVLMLTASADALGGAGGSLPGVDRVVAKPVTLARLRYALAEVAVRLTSGAAPDSSR